MTEKELSKTIDKVVKHASGKFNSLQFEKRKEICQYLSEMQILTMWQLLNHKSDLICSRWKQSVKEWLNNCLRTYINEYMREEMNNE